MQLSDAQGGGLLQLEDRDARGDESLERGAYVLEADGLVTDVKDDAEMATHQPFGLGQRHFGDHGELGDAGP